MDVIDDPASFHQDIIKYCKVISEKNNIGYTFGCTRCSLHSKADICFLESQNIIDPVATHGNCFTSILQNRYHLLLLFRCHTTKYFVFQDHSFKVIIAHLGHINRTGFFLKTCLTSHPIHSHMIITTDNLHFNTLRFEIVKGFLGIVLNLI